MNRDLLLATLELDEGLRVTLYDDATGKALTKGSTIVGWPTIGIGWNVATTPLTKDQYRIILGWLVDAKMTEFAAAFPWASSLPDPQQVALADMAYNLGVHGLQSFNIFLSLMQTGQYDRAADDLETTAWMKQVGARGPRIVALIRGTG